MAGIDDEMFGSPFPSVADGRGRGKGRGRGGRTGAAARQNATAEKLCLVPGCTCVCKNQKVWCGPHANSWSGLVTQADEQGPEAVAKVKILLTPGHEVERGEATGAYAKKNPPDKKYAKKQLFDVMTYMKTRFCTTQSVDRDREVPMTRAAFGKFCEIDLGLDLSETESYWLELYNNPRIERDMKGFRGREQLWVPTGPTRDRERLRGVTDGVTEISKAQKGYTDHDLQILLTHAHNQKTSVADAFITQGTPEENRALLKRSAQQAELDDAKSDAGSDKSTRKRKKTFDGDRDGPKYYASMNNDIEKLHKRIPVTYKAVTAAISELAKIEEQKKASDPALQGFLRKLHFRAQVFNKWQSDDTVVLLHNNFEPADGPLATPTLHPTLEVAELTPPSSEVVVAVVSVVVAVDKLLLLFCVCPLLCCCCCACVRLCVQLCYVVIHHSHND